MGLLNFCLQFHDPKLRNEFVNFCEIRKSAVLLLLFALFCTLLMLPINIISFFYATSAYDTMFAVITVVMIFAIATMSWIIYYYQIYNNELKGAIDHTNVRNIQSLLMILLSISLCLMAYRSQVAGIICPTIPKVIKQLVPGFNCNRECLEN